MLIIFKKVFYILALLLVNLYICEYINNKLTARMDLRRGYRISGTKGIGFPLVRFFKYISRNEKINIWTFFIFLLSLLIWSVVPITASLVLINKTLSLKEIVNSQHQYWNIILQPLGFIVFFISIFLQLKLLGVRGKSYISSGTNIGKEGTGLGKIIERFSVYMIVFFLIIILNILYLGGWQGIYIIRGEIILAIKFYIIFVILLVMDKAIGRIDS